MSKYKLLYQRGNYYIAADAIDEFRIRFDVCEFTFCINSKRLIFEPFSSDTIKKSFIGNLNTNSFKFIKWFYSTFTIEEALQKSLEYLDILYYKDIAKKHNIEYVENIIKEIGEGLKLKQEAYDLLEKELSKT